MILFEQGRSNIADEKYHYKGVEGMDSDERIELHIHSKEGGDSTLYAGEVIKQLDERGIPVAAVSDAHYIAPADRMAYQVISHWRKKEKCTEDYRFLNTEEMLRAFSYLSKEKAREVVIKNTHRVADMCETVSIIPKT